MLVEPAHCRVAKEHTAAAVGLQAMLVRIDNDRVGLIHGQERLFFRLVQMLRDQTKIAAIGRVQVYPEAVAFAQGENLRQGVDRTQCGRTHGDDDGPNISCAQFVFERVEIHSSPVVGRDRRERELQNRSDALVGVMRVLLRQNALARGQLTGYPQRLKIGEGATGGQMAEESASPFRGQPNIPAISATASISICELARPPSRAWLLGLMAMASA